MKESRDDVCAVTRIFFVVFGLHRDPDCAADEQALVVDRFVNFVRRNNNTYMSWLRFLQRSAGRKVRLCCSPCDADNAAIRCPSPSLSLPCTEQAAPVVHPAGRSSTWSWRPTLCHTYPRMRPGKSFHAVVQFRMTFPGIISHACGWWLANERGGARLKKGLSTAIYT